MKAVKLWFVCLAFLALCYGCQLSVTLAVVAQEVAPEAELIVRQALAQRRAVARAARFVAERRGFTGDEAEAVQSCLIERVVDTERYWPPDGWHWDASEVEMAIELDKLVEPPRSPNAQPEMQQYGSVGWCVRSELLRIEARRAGLSD